ncbi:MAG: metallophosphoesterase [Phycisphaerales bacterium]|nr:metallophosphoesterase [Phycisphaerales bacterium]
MNGKQVDRRDIVKLGAAGVLGLTLGGGRVAQAAARSVMPRSRRPAPATSLRLAHLTDIHVQPEKRAGEGMAACLKHVMALKDRPHLVVTGGDLVMDSFAHPQARTREQWDLLGKVLEDGIASEVRLAHALGNHDIWGWNKSKSKTTGDEPGWGKKYAMERLGLARPYHSLVMNGWRVIVLDSVAVDPRDPNGYIARLDDEQRAWLEAELIAAAEPVVVVSHVPILSMVALCYTGKANEKELRWETGAGLMHIDGMRLHKLFTEGAGKGKVKLCLSGHIHKIDRVEMDGLTYICDGAVCGSWWNGKKNQCDEGYGVVDLASDGSFVHRYETYGWKAASSPE